MQTTSWPGAAVDIATLAITLTATWLGLCSPAVFLSVLFAIVGARAALNRGGGGGKPGGGGVLASSAVVALAFAAAAVGAYFLGHHEESHA